MQRGRRDSGRLRKRRKIEPKRPTYLSRAKLLELDHGQLVGEIYMRMLIKKERKFRPANVWTWSQKFAEFRYI